MRHAYCNSTDPFLKAASSLARAVLQFHFITTVIMATPEPWNETAIHLHAECTFVASDFGGAHLEIGIRLLANEGTPETPLQPLADAYAHHAGCSQHFSGLMGFIGAGLAGECLQFNVNDEASADFLNPSKASPAIGRVAFPLNPNRSSLKAAFEKRYAAPKRSILPLTRCVVSVRRSGVGAPEVLELAVNGLVLRLACATQHTLPLEDGTMQHGQNQTRCSRLRHASLTSPVVDENRSNRQTLEALRVRCAAAFASRNGDLRSFFSNAAKRSP